MLNHVTLIGRLGRDIELKMTPSGTAVGTVGVATTEKWKDKSGEKKEETQWHNLVFWGKNAEVAEKFMKKGELHYFEGTIKYEKYKDKNEVEKTATKIHITLFKLLGNGRSGGGGYTPDDSNVPDSYKGNNRPGDEPDMNDGMPSRPFDSDDVPF